MRPYLVRSSTLMTSSSSSSYYKVNNKNSNKKNNNVKKICKSRSSRSVNGVIKCWKGQVTPPPDVLEQLQNGGIGVNVPPIPTPSKTVTRNDFPVDFLFGCSTSALQTEGRADVGGRGPSTWDFFIDDESSPGGGMATDSFHRYKEDVKLLKNMGVDVYRMSISWSRILPEGTIDGGKNVKGGIQFYNNFFQDLIANGIKPFVTLMHFDLPTALKQKYGGFIDRQIVDDFKAYADLCFREFGDKVKYWGTINEPQVWGQYGDANTDDPASQFTCMHNIILAHAAAVKVYRDSYQAKQKGEIGISVSVQWFEPLTEARKDVDAAFRAFDFYVGWVLEPLVYGHYPLTMQKYVGDILPKFTDEEAGMVKGSCDYVGVNYYTSRYAAAIPVVNSSNTPPPPPTSALDFQEVNITVDNIDGVPIGPVTPGSAEIYLYPKGLTEALVYITKHYNKPLIYVTENGYPDLRDDTIPVQIAIQDDARIDQIQTHLQAVKQALKSKANVGAYIIWSLLDCLETGSGYNVRYGLNYTDYLRNLERVPKKSAGWLNKFLAAKGTYVPYTTTAATVE